LVSRHLDIKTIYNRLKSSAKRRNIEFTISIIDLYDLSFPITCPILNIPLKFNTGTAQDDSYSIDRIDSSKGYTKDNIMVISLRANKLKNNATQSELQSLGTYHQHI
jgi:hypothetical protein